MSWADNYTLMKSGSGSVGINRETDIEVPDSLDHKHLTKLTPKTTNKIIPIFNFFCAFFVKLSTDFVHWKVLTSQQGNGWLISSLS